MNDNIDEWLNSLGFDETTSPSVSSPSSVPSTPEQIVTVPQPSEDSSSVSLTNLDFEEVLSTNGFAEPLQQPEEIIEGEEEGEEEENTEEYDENGGEGRDLDAEEDADFQVLVDSGGVVPVGGGILEQVRQVEEAAQEPRTLTLSDIENALLEMIHNDGTARDESSEEQQVSPVLQEGPLIPLNSPTLLLDESTTRFSGAEWFNEIQKKSIIIGGIGGIGSNCCFQLARMHPAGLYLYDDDTVETVNMAGQLFSRNDVGKSKVAAISDMISLYTNMQGIYAVRQKFTESTEAGDIMLCGFDNMEARKIFFRSWTAHIENKSEEEKKNCLFLDGRLSIDTLQVLCLTGDDYANQVRYAKEFLFSDAQAEHTVCSMKQTTYLACMIGSIMVNLFTNFCANLLDPVIPYDLPFFTEYDAHNMIFKTEK